MLCLHVMNNIIITSTVQINQHTLTSACFSCPDLFGGTELFNLLAEAFVDGDVTVFHVL